MAGLFDAILDPQFREDIKRGLLDAGNRGAVAGLLGGPVDLATMAMRPFGYATDAPVGGSEWIGQQMQRAGLVSDQRNPVAEALASVALPLAAHRAGPALFNAEEAARVGVNNAYIAGRRPLSAPVFNTEASVTSPPLLQGVDLGNSAGLNAARNRVDQSRRAVGGQHSASQMDVGQGAWQGSAGFEANPVFMQQMPRHSGGVADQPYMRYAAQVSENLQQDGNAVARFVPHLLSDVQRSNAAMLNKVTPAQIRKMGEAGLTNDMVIAARPGNKALVMGFDDSPGQMQKLIAQVKAFAPDAKVKTGVSAQDVDRVYMTRQPGEYGPSYQDFGAKPRSSVGLDALDEALGRQVYR